MLSHSTAAQYLDASTSSLCIVFCSCADDLENSHQTFISRYPASALSCCIGRRLHNCLTLWYVSSAILLVCKGGISALIKKGHGCGEEHMNQTTPATAVLAYGTEPGLRFACLLDGSGHGNDLDWRGVARWHHGDGVLWIHLERDDPAAAAWINDE